MKKFLGGAGGTSADDATLVAGPAPAATAVQSLWHVVGYEVLSELGRGGAAVVYKAWQSCPRRLVALKLLQAGCASRSARDHLRAEAEVMARLNHPNILQVYTAGEENGAFFYAMEWCRRGSLAQNLSRAAPSPDAAAAVVADLAAAMRVVHRAGVVHGDLKPQNILLAEDGAPRIADFGLAVWAAEYREKGRAWPIMGTPSYMAPEQTRGEAAIRPAADVYGLGAILFELLTGVPPFQAPSVLETIEQVRDLAPPAPSRLRPGVPGGLEGICLKCLEKDPALRYAGAAELADDLRRFCGHRPNEPYPTGRPGRPRRG